jgi:capsular polysaccharide biosynthesis protein/cytochrome c-type biogenesis protein CcmH/NrfG
MDQESNEQKLERAMRLHNEGRLDHAEALYRELLRDEPGHQVALHLSGLIAHQRGRHREAVTLMEMALAGGASNVAIYTNCGLAYRALGDLDKAARQIAWAIALDPESADAHFNYALVLRDQGLQQQAAVHLEIALELRPDSAQAGVFLGRIYLDDDKPLLAAEKLRAALHTQTDDAETHYLLAKALLAQGDTRGALQSLAAVLKFKPDHGPAAHLFAKTSFELCREAEALAGLEQAQRSAADGAKNMTAAAARLGQVDLCGADNGAYTRLARPQWLSLPQPKALPEGESQHFALPKPFTHEIFMARLAQVRVLPKELLLLTRDGRLLLDGVVGFAQQYALREGGAIRHCADDGRLLLLLPQRCVEVDEACVWLGAASGHFQWVFESLARLWVVEQKQGLQDLPLIVQDTLTRWQDELLQLLGYGEKRRIAAPTDAMLECRELHAASMVSVGFFVSPVAIQHLRREFGRRIAPATDTPQRIYLSRRGADTRRLANEDELLPLLEQHGFVAVHAESLSAVEQLALFRSAEVILGVEGAALVNLLIAPAHAKVGVIVARGLYRPRHYYVSAPIGHDFTYLSAEPDYASHAALAECDVTLPRESLQAFLAAL